MILDLDYSQVKAMKGLDVFELRIQDCIGGNDNLRIIFFVGPTQKEEEWRIIWILSVFQKRRNDFTTQEIRVFKARRILVLERFYN